MRRLPRATWISIIVIGLLTMLASVTGSIGANALTWLSPWVALLLFVLISLSLIGFSLWQERQKAASEPSMAAAHTNRQLMLDRVQNKWIAGFLENSLYYSYDEQLLPLPLCERVGSRFDLVLSNPLVPTKIMPSGTTLVQVLDQAGGELLILGEPGAGKTTLLLELARDLLKQAKDNPAALIPLVLTLSSWATRKLSLEQWIVEELKTKYDIPSQIGEEWVRANQLLLLLDGLDEVASSALPACIDAINAYYHQAHRSLVVCSRTKEFLDQPGRLALHTAVIVQPLSSEQVDSYLDDLAVQGENVEGLKQALRQSAALRALATTPLFLTVLILAYHGKPVQELLALMEAAPTDQLHLLFHNYIERSLQRRGTRSHASAQQIKHWLAWLARQMTRHNQSGFYLQQFRQDWLPRRQRAFYQLSIGVPVALFFGVVFGVAIGLRFGALFGALFGLFPGLLGVSTGWALGKMEPGEGPTWSWKGLLSGLFLGPVYGLIVGAIYGLVYGLIVGLGFGLIGGFLGGLGAAMQRFILRFWLWQARYAPAPWRYVAFLDDAVEQLLLRKVGEEYIFRHLLLQDYFASLDIPGFPRLVIIRR